MECACIDIDVGDSPEFCFQKEMTARKQHKCCECGRIIKPGENYENTFGKWGYYPETFKTCFDCLSVRKEFFCSFVFTAVWDELTEYLTPGECLDKAMLEITERARGMVLDIIDVEV